MMIDTIRGPLPASELQVLTEEQQIPIGKAVATTYLHGGEVVKRDVTVIVDGDKVPAMHGQENF